VVSWQKIVALSRAQSFNAGHAHLLPLALLQVHLRFFCSTGIYEYFIHTHHTFFFSYLLFVAPRPALHFFPCSSLPRAGKQSEAYIAVLLLFTKLRLSGRTWTDSSSHTSGDGLIAWWSAPGWMNLQQNDRQAAVSVKRNKETRHLQALDEWFREIMLKEICQDSYVAFTIVAVYDL
jgi:hypothetical protein